MRVATVLVMLTIAFADGAIVNRPHPHPSSPSSWSTSVADEVRLRGVPFNRRPEEAGPGPLVAYVDGQGEPSRFWLRAGTARRKPSEPKVRARRLSMLARSCVGRRRPGPCRLSPQLLETARSTTRHRRSALLEGPVRCALTSGLSRGRRRWPSWACARVPGTNLSGALEAQPRVRYRLGCPAPSLSHHAVRRSLPDQPDSRPPPPVRRNVTPGLPQPPRHVPSPGRPPCASSAPRRCAPSCSPAPPSPA